LTSADPGGTIACKETPGRALSEVASPSTATPDPPAASEGVSEGVEEVGSVDADGVPCMLYRPTTS